MSATNLASGMTWHGPTPLDMGAYGSNYLSYQAPGSVVAYNTVPASNAFFSFQSFDFRGSPNASSAALFATAYGNRTTSAARTLLHYYWPESQGGNGWAPPGSWNLLTDDGSVNFSDAFLSFAPNGDLLAAFGTFANYGTTTNVQSLEMRFNGGLLAPTNQLLAGFPNTSGGAAENIPSTSAVASISLPSAPAAVAPAPPWVPQSAAWNPASMAWDNRGYAWIAANVPDNNGGGACAAGGCCTCNGAACPCTQLALSQYSPFTGWSGYPPPLSLQLTPARMSYPRYNIAPPAAAPKVELLNDGLGVTAVYLDEATTPPASNLAATPPYLAGGPVTGAPLKSAWSLDPVSPFNSSIPVLTTTANTTSGSSILHGVISLSGVQPGQIVTGAGIPASTIVLSTTSNLLILSTSGNTTIGSNQLTGLASTAGLVVGQFISGAGIPSNTTIVSIAGATVTMSTNAAATGSVNPVLFFENQITLSANATSTTSATAGPQASISISKTKADLSTQAGSSYSDVYNFASAADQSGNVVVVFTQDLLPQPAIPLPPTIPDTVPSNRYPFVRLFASARSASGTWVGPTRIDTNFAQAFTTSSLFQDSTGVFGSAAVGGIHFATPGVAYLGNGRFLAAWAELDNVAHTSGLYVRGYTVGTGWDPDSQIVTLEKRSYLSLLDGVTTPTEAYRFVNDIRMVSDGQGDALLVLHYVVQSNAGLTANDHNYAIKVYRYVAGSGWDSGFVIPESICQASAGAFPLGTASYYCWQMRTSGAIFPGGESVVVFPALAGGLGTVANPAYFRLFSMEYRQ